jgi:hypothetical protein
VSEPKEWLTLAEVGELLGQSPNQVRRLVRDHHLIGLRRDQGLAVPADFVLDGVVVKGLSGTLVLLFDAGYTDEEALRWLYAADDTLPGRPIDALRENRGTEIRRRAQAAGF